VPGLNAVARPSGMRDSAAVRDLLPVLWLCGPSGVGKSTVGWELFAGSAGAGYVDIDQLGMCYPEIPSDPGRTLVEAKILGRMVDSFAAAGVRGLIVSGYVDSRRGVHTEYLSRASLTVLRLRCDLPALRRRLEERGRLGEPREAALAEAEILDHSGLPYPCLDTTGRDPADVLAWVRDRWPLPPARPPGPWPDPAVTDSAAGEVVWLCGPAAVGTSTVGWAVAEWSRRAGHITGFADLRQLGFLNPDREDHRLRAANLAAVQAGFRGNGARRLVVVGPVEDSDQVRLYAEALPAPTVTLVRLHAGAEALRERIRERGRGSGPPIAGDALRGRSAAVLAAAHAAAVAQAAALERAGIGDFRVDTDGRPVGDVARTIVRRLGW
jgi:broad-specificity NMP kinase